MSTSIPKNIVLSDNFFRPLSDSKVDMMHYAIDFDFVQ